MSLYRNKIPLTREECFRLRTFGLQEGRKVGREEGRERGERKGGRERGGGGGRGEKQWKSKGGPEDWEGRERAERNHYPGLHPSLCGYSGLKMRLYKTTHCHAQDGQGRKEFKMHVEQGSQGVLFVDKIPSEFSNKTY